MFEKFEDNLTKEEIYNLAISRVDELKSQLNQLPPDKRTEEICLLEAILNEMRTTLSKIIETKDQAEVNQAIAEYKKSVSYLSILFMAKLPPENIN